MKVNFLDSPVGKTLFVKSLPMFFGLFASITYNLVDTFFVAKLGTQPLAAMSFGFPIVMIILNLIMGIATGVNSLLARSVGEQQYDQATLIAQKGLQFTFFFSILITIVGLLSLKPLFYFLGVDESLIGYVQEYMTTWYYGVIFMGLSIVGNSIFRAKGNTLYPSIVLILGAVLNAILDPILIFGLGPIPALGVQGAAITTVLGNALSTYLIFTKMYRDDKISLFSIFKKIDLFLVRKISIIALPTAFANSLTPVSTAVTNSMLVVYGSAAVAANSVATRIETIPFIAIFALASVLAPFVGQNWGAKNYGRIREALKKSFFFSYLMGAVCALFLILQKEIVLSLFDQNPHVLHIGALYFSWIPLTYGVLGTVFLANHAMNAVGKPFLGNAFSASRLIFLYIPLAYFLNISVGYKGIFFARFLANLIVGVLATVLTYYIFFKKTKEAKTTLKN